MADQVEQSCADALPQLLVLEESALEHEDNQDAEGNDEGVRDRFGPFGDELSPLPVPTGTPSLPPPEHTDIACPRCNQQGCSYECPHCYSNNEVAQFGTALHVY